MRMPISMWALMEPMANMRTMTMARVVDDHHDHDDADANVGNKEGNANTSPRSAFVKRSDWQKAQRATATRARLLRLQADEAVLLASGWDERCGLSRLPETKTVPSIEQRGRVTAAASEPPRASEGRAHLTEPEGKHKPMAQVRTVG